MRRDKYHKLNTPDKWNPESDYTASIVIYAIMAALVIMFALCVDMI